MKIRLAFAAVIAALAVSSCENGGQPKMEAIGSPISSSILISQVYGGGGNAGATWRRDFVELYNRSAVPVDLTNWSLQYAGSTGVTFTAGNRTILNGTIQPGAFFLVALDSGGNMGVPLPAPDQQGDLSTAGGMAG